MKISIITVAYNAGATISDTIRSVIAQDHTDYEHIIVDGGSTDDTLDRARALSHSKLCLVSEPDTGIYDAMNKGLQRATGGLIGFLNADDFYCRTDSLAKFSRIAEATSLDAVASGIVIVNQKRPERVQRSYPSRGFRPWMLRLAYMPPHPGFYVRREAAQKVGYFDPTLRFGADFDWIMRFYLIHQMRAALVPESLVAMRTGGKSQELSGIHEGRRDTIRSLRAHGLGAFSPLVWGKYIIKAPQFLALASKFPVPEHLLWTP